MRRLIVFACLALGAPAASAQDYTHKEYFEHYEGTQTCLTCHREEAEQFFYSQHYQGRADSSHVAGAGGRQLGKMETINDFCTNPKANWIGVVRNSRGEVLAKGCSGCHAGFGQLPSAQISPEQLRNVDCLICHASGYRKDLYPTEEGGWQWRPILWKNQAGLDSVSKRISLPTRTMCLRCHANSGGGPNYKRGDLEYALKDPSEDFDVHMASEGLDMQCVDCHAGSDHRVRGRGTDLAGSDLPGQPLSCDEAGCHGGRPHPAEVLNRHDRVYCTVCHLPSFAKEDATDMRRDWSTPVYDPDRDKYSATIDLERNVAPVVAWYNGKIQAQLPGEPIQRRPDGTVGMVLPQGSRADPEARLFAFKLHRGRLPVLTDSGWIVPIVVEEFYADGDIDRAVRNAARQMYGLTDADYTWVDTVRYMGVFHEVPPASQALECLDCHGPAGRIRWRELGYEDGDPILK